MNSQKLKIRNWTGRFRTPAVPSGLLAVLAVLIVAGFGADQAYADWTDPSAQNTGQSQHRETIEIRFTGDDNASPQPNSSRVSRRPLVTPGIAANGIRMYDVQPNESGGWPVRPAHDDTYGQGELIAVAVTFTEDVIVSNDATFRIRIGFGGWRGLVPASHRGNTVIFASLIQPSHEDTDGVWIGDNTFTLDHNPANYFRTADGSENVNLTHSSLGTQSGHKVDGSSTRPEINRVRITSSPQSADFYVRGEGVQVEVRFDRSVVVSGNPAARLRIESFGSTATRTANYLRGSGTSTLVFEYRTSQFDNDSNGIAIPVNTLAQNGDIGQGTNGGGSIKGSSGGLHANLTSRGRGNNANHKSDGRYAATPEIMAAAQWGWTTQTGTSESISMDFTIREDPGHFSEDHALVMGFGWSSIGSNRFAFGIRTDVDNPETDGSEGKGIFFNRWGTHDTTLARTPDGWVGTGMRFGNSISIQKLYDWGTGDYTVRIAPDGDPDDTGALWYGMWIRNHSTDVETFMGSLKFPGNDGSPPKINPRGDLYHSMLGILGRGVIKPHEIPVFEIALSPPDEGDSIDPPKRVTAAYSQFNGVMTNANITHDRADNIVIMRAGGTTLRTTDPGTVITIRNDPAEGKPVINGTTQVGQSLGVNTDNVSDPDGPEQPSFSYQWIRNNGTQDTDIQGAVSRFYTLTNADAGNTIKVRVSFTDDAAYSEVLTSEPTAEITYPPLTAEFLGTPTSHNGTRSFTFELRFSENVSGLSYLTLRDHAFTVDGGEVIKARRLDRPRNIRWEITVQTSGNNDVIITLPATTDCEATGAICTADGRMLVGQTAATVEGPG